MNLSHSTRISHLDFGTMLLDFRICILIICAFTPSNFVGRYSVAHVATYYELDGTGIECREGRAIPHPTTPAPETTQSPTQRVSGLFPGSIATYAWP